MDGGTKPAIWHKQIVLGDTLAKSMDNDENEVKI
jgi:hypothetical protein